jgi:hypothetical protein
MPALFEAIFCVRKNLCAKIAAIFGKMLKLSAFFNKFATKRIGIKHF